MAVLVDVSREGSVEKRDLTSGVPLILGEDSKQVVLTKYISNDSKHADFAPQGEWFEQVVVDVGRKGKEAKIVVKGDDGELRGITLDDGLIIDLVATMSGLWGVLPGMPPMDAGAVEEFEAATEKKVPLYQRWDFRITRILKTNGPELRSQLARSEEQKKQASQAEMFNAFTAMFKGIGEQLVSQGNPAPSAQEIVAAAVRGAGKEK